MTPSVALGLTLGSVAGGFARYALGGAVQRAAGDALPWGVLSVNLLGCLIAGFVDALSGRIPPEARATLVVGFCGAFTTFSALMLDVSRLARGGETGRALVYVALSAAAGVLCVRLGALAAARF